VYEANAIALEIEKVQLPADDPRPAKKCIVRLEVRVQKIVVNDLNGRYVLRHDLGRA